MHACIVYMQSNLLRQYSYIMQLHSLGNFIPFVPCNQYIDRNSLKCHKLSGLNAENCSSSI